MESNGSFYSGYGGTLGVGLPGAEGNAEINISAVEIYGNVGNANNAFICSYATAFNGLGLSNNSPKEMGMLYSQYYNITKDEDMMGTWIDMAF